jgi:hypothetical protein
MAISTLKNAMDFALPDYQLPNCMPRMSASGVRREKAAFSSGCEAHPASAPAGSYRSNCGGNETVEAFGKMHVTKYGDSASVQAATRVNAEQACASSKGWHIQWESVPPG